VPVEQLTLLPLDDPQPQSSEGHLNSLSALSSALKAFHEHMLHENLSTNTVKAFDSDLRLLARFAGSSTPLSELTPGRLESFLDYLRYERGVPCKPKSLSRRLTTLKVFFSWLTKQGVLLSDPAAPLVHHRAKTPVPRVLSEAEVEELLTATDQLRRDPDHPDARPHLLITLLLATAVKKGECMRIMRSDIDVSDPRAASVFIRYANARQRHKERRLRLSPQFAHTLPDYLEQYRPETQLFPCTARNLEYVLDGCAKRAGLIPRVLSFEALRWTCAVRDLQAGMEADTLRRKLGLSCITWAETLEKLGRLTTAPL